MTPKHIQEQEDIQKVIAETKVKGKVDDSDIVTPTSPSKLGVDSDIVS